MISWRLLLCVCQCSWVRSRIWSLKLFWVLRSTSPQPARRLSLIDATASVRHIICWEILSNRFFFKLWHADSQYDGLYYISMLFILFFNKKSGIKTLLNIVVNINCLILLKHGFKEHNLIDQHYLQWFHSNIVMLMVYEVCIASRNSLCSV